MAYVIGFTYLCKTYYAGWKQETERWGWTNEDLYSLMTMSQHYFVFMACVVVYTLLYYFEMPFFEQFKAFDEPWPWKADNKKWRKLLGESAALVGFNYFVMIPLLGF